ncbi:Ldi domain-containing protein [Favolaschia claudopus]|uniref:Ldi domain-containing protein n=1 Tax=Favolaschia claudopus TaxID=2862362 RepID=A0AAW0EHX8_9AGAR
MSTSITTQFPETLPASILAGAQKLSLKQAGHIRHIYNLATTRPGEWPRMSSMIPGQEYFDALRYQLGHMTYAMGAAHYHRLPALRSVFKSLFESLISRMLEKDVWTFWYNTSQSGKLSDPQIKELLKPRADPVLTENIMYSGHLFMMSALHAMLFDDDKYDEPDSFVFNWEPLFWGMGSERFSYNRTSLQKAIMDEFEREKWIGVCCEPNCVFIICNQFPIIGIRYTDVRNGTNIVDGVIENYTAAWKGKDGFVQDDGLFIRMMRSKHGDRVLEQSVSFTAWACAFMNAWNSEQVQALYPKMALGFLSKIPGENRVNVHGPGIGQAIRSLVREQGADPDSPETLRKAREIAGPPETGRWRAEFGYICQWVSEVGDQETLDGLMRHAEMFLNPTWEKGGLFYERSDNQRDVDGNWTGMDSFSSNAGIPYGSLNVRNGQKTMWEKPWKRGHSTYRPYIDGVDLRSGVDFLRGEWDANVSAMILTARTWDGSTKTISPSFHNLPEGPYGVYANGKLTEVKAVKLGESVAVPIEVGAEEVNLVLLAQRNHNIIAK